MNVKGISRYQAIGILRETIAIDKAIGKFKTADILECLDEIQEGLKNNQKSEFAMKSLIDIRNTFN